MIASVLHLKFQYVFTYPIAKEVESCCCLHFTDEKSGTIIDLPELRLLVPFTGPLCELIVTFIL